jgi:16S rRNA (guanine527-N7)-methyltransferase
MTRRIRFLEAMRAELPIPNATVVEAQVEHARGSFDLVVFRAFRPFERKLFKRVFAICSPAGFVAAWKGRHDRARSELAEIAGLYASAEVVPVAVPFLEDERCLVILRPVSRS